LIAIKEAKKSSPSPHWLMGPHFTGRVFDFWRIWCVVFYRPLNSLLYYALKVQDVFVPMAVRSPLWNWSKKTIIEFEWKHSDTSLHNNNQTRDNYIWFTYQLNPKIAAASCSTIKPKGSIKSL
jgi:hypothetical protein